MDWRSSSKMGRRRFFKNAAAAGVSASSLYWGTQEGLAAAAEPDEVPYVKFLHGAPKPEGDGRKPIYDSIPREEWERRWTAVNLRDNVARQLKQKYDTNLISAEFEPMKQSPTGFGVSIAYIEVTRNGEVTDSPDVPKEQIEDSFGGTGSGEAAKDEYHATREGIPIVVERRQERGIGCGEATLMDQKTINAISAGIDVTCVDEGSGSLTAPFMSNDYGEGWIISGHVAGGELGGAAGTVVKQGEAGGEERIGEVRDSQVFGHIDWAFVEDTESEKYPVEATAEPEDISSADYEIGGITTDDTLVNKAGTSETFYTQGVSTERLASTINKVGGSGTSYVVSEHDVTDGDSGGILFGVGDGGTYAYVAGSLRAEVNEDNDGDDCPDDAESTTAETIENKAKGYFMKY